LTKAYDTSESFLRKSTVQVLYVTFASDTSA